MRRVALVAFYYESVVHAVDVTQRWKGTKPVPGNLARARNQSTIQMQSKSEKYTIIGR
jgi:hypothetical protein